MSNINTTFNEMIHRSNITVDNKVTTTRLLEAQDIYLHRNTTVDSSQTSFLTSENIKRSDLNINFTMVKPKEIEQSSDLALQQVWKKNTFAKKPLKHFAPSVKEWNNSIYSFHKNNIIKLLPSIDKSVYNLLYTYFNLNPIQSQSLNNSIHFKLNKAISNLLKEYFKSNRTVANRYSLKFKNKIIKRIISLKFNRLSMIRFFISKPEIKHTNNKIIITIYTYNRKRIYFFNKIKTIFKLNTNLRYAKSFSHAYNKYKSPYTTPSVQKNIYKAIDLLHGKQKNYMAMSFNTVKKNSYIIKKLKYKFMKKLLLGSGFPKHYSGQRVIFKDKFNDSHLQTLHPNYLKQYSALANKRITLNSPINKLSYNLKSFKNKYNALANKQKKTLTTVLPLNTSTLKILKRKLKKRTRLLLSLLSNKSISTLFAFLCNKFYVKSSNPFNNSLSLAKASDTPEKFLNSVSSLKRNTALKEIDTKLNAVYSKFLHDLSNYKVITLSIKFKNYLKHIILFFNKRTFNLLYKFDFSIHRFLKKKETRLKKIWLKKHKKYYLKQIKVIKNKIKQYKKTIKIYNIISRTKVESNKVKIAMKAKTILKNSWSNCLKQKLNLKKDLIIKLKWINRIIYLNPFIKYENMIYYLLITKYKSKYSILIKKYYEFLIKQYLEMHYSDWAFSSGKKDKSAILHPNNLSCINTKSKSSLTAYIPYKFITKLSSKKGPLYKVLTPILYNTRIKKILNIKPIPTNNFYIYKYYCSMLYFNSYLFNSNNLLPLKDILKKIYNKKIELNIINLKYLHLDSNIFAEAITRKLRDRKKRVLRVLKLGLNLSKQPYFKIHFHRDKVQLNSLFLDKNLNIHSNFILQSLGNHGLALNKYLIFKPKAYRLRLFLYHMKQKIISGLRLQGTGRLTKRLTASRAISKYRYMGSLKNLNSSYEGISTTMLRGFVKSNLQYTNINHYNRNGSFGTKVSISVY